PLDRMSVHEAASRHRAILTIEEHSVEGGFGSRVAEALLMAGLAPRFAKLGVTEGLRNRIGSQSWVLGALGAGEGHGTPLLVSCSSLASPVLSALRFSAPP